MICEKETSANTVSRQRDSWLSPPQAAEIAGVHRATMNRWCEQIGKPLARKIGGRWRVSPSALAQLLSEGQIDGKRAEAA